MRHFSISTDIHGVTSVAVSRGKTASAGTDWLDLVLNIADGGQMLITAFGPQPPVIDGDAIEAIQTAAYAEGRKDEREEWEALRAQTLGALRKAESWLAEWASAEPYISEIRAAIDAATGSRP